MIIQIRGVDRLRVLSEISFLSQKLEFFSPKKWEEKIGGWKHQLVSSLHPLMPLVIADSLIKIGPMVSEIPMVTDNRQTQAPSQSYTCSVAESVTVQCLDVEAVWSSLERTTSSGLGFRNFCLALYRISMFCAWFINVCFFPMGKEQCSSSAPAQRFFYVTHVCCTHFLWPFRLILCA